MDGQLADVSNPCSALDDFECRGNPADWDDEETTETPILDEEGDEDEEDEEIEEALARNRESAEKGKRRS